MIKKKMIISCSSTQENKKCEILYRDSEVDLMKQNEFNTRVFKFITS